MKWFAAVLFTLLASLAYAEDSVELIGPGITWHVTDGGVANLYDHKISSDGRLIYTPSIGLKKEHINSGMYNSFALFTAKNSIGSPIYGFMGGTGASFFGDSLDLGFAFGGYVQNNEDFRYAGITPFSMTGGTNAFVPLLGLEINYKFRVSDHTFIGFNNLITPVITNHNLSFGYNY